MLAGLHDRIGNMIANFVRMPFGHAPHSAAEIDLLVEEGEEAGIIPHDEAEYVRAVFELSDKKVRDERRPFAASRNAARDPVRVFDIEGTKNYSCLKNGDYTKGESDKTSFVMRTADAVKLGAIGTDAVGFDNSVFAD